MKRSRKPSPTDPLGSYLHEVRRNPLLTPEEERTLARAAREGGAKEAHRLVTANLRFVVKIAYRYRSPGVRVGDLIQEGNLGLMRAARTFDPERGSRFVCYAAWAIRAAMQGYLLRSRMGGEAGRHVSLDEPIADDHGASRLEALAGEDAPQDAELAAREMRAIARARVHAALACLGPRERYIVERRAMSDEPATLTALAAQLGLSRERTRQLEARALKRLRRELAALADELDLPPPEARDDREARAA